MRLAPIILALLLGAAAGCTDLGELVPVPIPPPDPPGPPAAPDTVTVLPVADSSIYADSGVELSNGTGAHLHSGNNGSGTPRRALLRFALDGVIPAGASVSEASVTLRVVGAPASDSTMVRTLSLHRVTARWSEGPSNADATGNGGGGTPALPGDVTWTSAVFDSVPWSAPGGDFAAAASAGADARRPAVVTWGPGPALVSDVQGWVDDPATNFGWILIGAETGMGTARRIVSRENPAEPDRPRLRVIYTEPSP